MGSSIFQDGGPLWATWKRQSLWLQFHHLLGLEEARPCLLGQTHCSGSSFAVDLFLFGAWVFEILRANSKLGSIDFRFTVRAVENSTLGTHAGVQSYHSKGLTWVQLSIFGPFFPLFMDEFFHGFSIPRFSSYHIWLYACLTFMGFTRVCSVSQNLEEKK